MKKIILLLFILLFATLAHASVGLMQFGHAPTGITTTQTLKIGGGGWLRGLDIAADGTKVVRTDTYGAYVWNGSAWVQLVTTASLPNGDPMNSPTACINALGSTCGVYEIRIAASNTNIAYMMLNGYVYKTTNLKSFAAATWAATGFTQVTTSNPNDASAQYGHKIAIDPADANRLVVCTETNGCFKSTDGATTFNALTGVTNAGSIGMLVDFDPSSTTGGSTPTFYVSSYGTGIYKCTGGLASPSCALTTSTPTTHQFMTVAADGTVYLTANTGGSDQTLHIFTSGTTWQSKTVGTNGTQIQGVAIDPAHSTFASNAFIFVINGGGQTSYSQNSGSTWSGYQTITRVSSDVPWLGPTGTNEGYMTAGQIAYDPNQANVVYFSQGIGAWTASPATGGTVTWTSQTVGIEQLVANWIISPPGGTPSVFSWDRPAFYISNPAAYPSTVAGCASPLVNSIIIGWSADWATSAPINIFALCNYGVDTSGKSTDGGQTYTAFGTVPTGVPGSFIGGAMAAASSTSVLFALSNDGPLNQTSDGGSTWTIPTISGVATSGARGWCHAYFVDCQIVCADRVTANTFYAYNSAVNGSTSTAGIYKYNGSTWSRALTGHLDNVDGFNMILKCSPTTTGKMYYTSGNQTPGPYPHTQSFYKCTDSAGTVTCNAVANVKEVWAFGFGKAKPSGSGEAAIYIAGWVSNVWGIYRSDDDAATWVLLTTAPFNSLDSIKTLEGDANTYGTFYFGFGGSGFGYGVLN